MVFMAGEIEASPYTLPQWHRSSRPSRPKTTFQHGRQTAKPAVMAGNVSLNLSNKKNKKTSTAKVKKRQLLVGKCNCSVLLRLTYKRCGDRREQNCQLREVQQRLVVVLPRLSVEPRRYKSNSHACAKEGRDVSYRPPGDKPLESTLGSCFQYFTSTTTTPNKEGLVFSGVPRGIRR